jgi:histidinol dehydrogenase
VPQRLDAEDEGFPLAFASLLGMKREISEDVDETVKTIIADIIEGGDGAVLDYSRRLDGLDLTADRLRVSRREIDAAVAACGRDVLDALGLAKERIETYHGRQKPDDWLSTDAVGVTVGWRWTALDSVGLYVPGGTASYPSSVLMNAVPAKVAGVPRVVMVVPTPHGKLNPLVLAAAQLAGVDEVYRIGGAQAVAALAYGTESIAPVAKIVGPGNAYVAAAKRRVFGQVGIDMIAGPSEVLILADETTGNAEWIAADLLAQAEHDAAAQAILITDSRALADEVEAAVERQLPLLPRADIARASWRDYGAVIVVPSLAAALPLVDRLAPEHLEIEAADADALAQGVRNAGAIFLGSHTPEAIGDYVGGPNHVLPTARSARFSSGLGVLDFMKRTSILKCDADALRALGPAAIGLARAEGLEAHARSVALRLNL